MADEEKLTKDERKALRKQEKLEIKAKMTARERLNKIGWCAGLVAVVALIGFWIYQSIIPVPQNEKNKPVNAIAAGDWVKGNPQAQVKIIEYSDLQCPSCAKVYPILDTLLKDYPNQVVLAYRHFPLKEIHFQGELAAQAAEAAGKQGKFWEMHDKLFDTQADWSGNSAAGDKFNEYAQSLSLNMNQFKTDLQSKEIKGLVKADYLSALEQNLSSTPTFFINGELTPTPNGLDQFKQLIDQQLQLATASAQAK